MKTEDVPQDLKYYKGTIARDLNYAVDEDGQYRAVESCGWAPKNEALDLAWEDVHEKCRAIAQKIRKGESSPLEYHAVKNLMTVRLLSEYTGFSKRLVRKHYRPEVFQTLDEHTLEIYADALRISVEELRSIPE